MKGRTDGHDLLWRCEVRSDNGEKRREIGNIDRKRIRARGKIRKEKPNDREGDGTFAKTELRFSKKD